MLGLTVASGVSHGSVADLGADASAVGSEGAAGELASIVDDDPVGHTKTASDSFDEFDSRARRNGSNGLHLWPFRKFVDGNV